MCRSSVLTYCALQHYSSRAFQKILSGFSWEEPLSKQSLPACNELSWKLLIWLSFLSGNLGESLWKARILTLLIRGSHELLPRVGSEGTSVGWHWGPPCWHVQVVPPSLEMWTAGPLSCKPVAILTPHANVHCKQCQRRASLSRNRMEFYSSWHLYA